jgi:hypothetical protein
VTFIANSPLFFQRRDPKRSLLKLLINLIRKQQFVKKQKFLSRFLFGIRRRKEKAIKEKRRKSVSPSAEGDKRPAAFDPRKPLKKA